MSHIFNNAEPGSQLIWTVMTPATLSRRWLSRHPFTAKKQNPKPRLRVLRRAYAETTAASIHLLMVSSRTTTKRRSYERRSLCRVNKHSCRVRSAAKTHAAKVRGQHLLAPDCTLPRYFAKVYY